MELAAKYTDLSRNAESALLSMVEHSGNLLNLTYPAFIQSIRKVETLSEQGPISRFVQS